MPCDINEIRSFEVEAVLSKTKAEALILNKAEMLLLKQALNAQDPQNVFEGN